MIQGNIVEVDDDNPCDVAAAKIVAQHLSDLSVERQRAVMKAISDAIGDIGSSWASTALESAYG